MHASIHRVTKITVDEPVSLDIGSYVRRITIKGKDEVVEISIFSDDAESLKIYADNAQMEDEFEQATIRG